MRLSGSDSIRFRSGPVSSWNAWLSVVSSERSHSQLRERTGLPNTARKRSGAGARGDVVEACRHPGHPGQGVEQLLRLQGPDQGAGEVGLVLAVGVVGQG